MTDHRSAEYLERARARLKYARRRQTAWSWLLAGPLIVLGTALKVFSRHDYPAGDVRNEPLFWAALALVVLIFVGAILVSVVRYLRSTPPSTFVDAAPPSRDTRGR